MLCVHEISWARPQNKAEDTQLCWNYCADSNKKLKDATEMWTPFVLCYFSFPPSLHVYADECRQILGCLAQILVSFWLALLLSHCHWAHRLGIDAWFPGLRDVLVVSVVPTQLPCAEVEKCCSVLKYTRLVWNAAALGHIGRAGVFILPL